MNIVNDANPWWIFLVLGALAAALIMRGVKRRQERREDMLARGEDPDAPAEPTQEPAPDELPWEVVQEALRDAPPIPSESESSQSLSEDARGIPQGESPSLFPTADADRGAHASDFPNVDIREHAWRLFKKNYKRLLPLMLVVAILELLPKAVGYLLPNAAWWTNVAEFLIVPITGVGYAYAGLTVWRDGGARMADLFAFASSWKRLGKCWAVALLEGVLGVLIVALPVMISTMAGSTGLFVTIYILCGIVLCWLMLRLELVYYVLADAPQTGIIAVFVRSFNATKGKLGRLIGMTIMTRWPYFLLAVASYIANRSRGSLAEWAFIPQFLLGVFYAGYVQIAKAGLADELLRETAGEEQA